MNSAWFGFIDKIKNAKVLNNVIFVLMLFTLYTPYEFTIIPFWDKVGGIIRLFVTIIIYLEYIPLIYKRKKIDILLLFFNFYAFITFISTVYNNGDIAKSLWSNWILINSLIMLVYIGFHRNYEETLLNIYIYMFAIAIMNAVAVYVFYPYGMWQFWGVQDTAFYIVGNYNRGIEFTFPALLAGAVYLNNRRSRLLGVSYVVLLLSSIWMAFKVKSHTQLAIYIILPLTYLLILLIRKRFKKTDLSVWWVLSADIILSGLIILTKIQYIIQDLVGKTDVTFSGREIIWDSAIKYIKTSPIIGNGVEIIPVITEKLQSVAGIHCHNIYLEILYQSGIIGFVLYGIIVALSVFNISRIYNFRLKIILVLYIGLLFLASTVEAYVPTLMFLSFTLIYYISKVEARKRDDIRVQS